MNFQNHIRAAILKARRGVGLIRHLSKYVARNVLNLCYKLYVRPHLDYRYLLCHRYNQEMRLGFTQKFEQTQYSAALSVSGAWKGTNRQNPYDELGCEDLYHRRWYRSLCHFYNLRRTASLGSLFDEISPELEQSYNLRQHRVYEQNISRTTRFSHTYFQNVLYEWNLLNNNIKNSQSISEFKRILLAIVRPHKNPLYCLSDIEGVKKLTKLRVNFSPLNEHRFRHNFDCSSPTCVCGRGIENNGHFLLH